MSATAAAATAVQLVGGIALAPLVPGLVQHWKARLQGRRGPTPLQPYRDLRRLFSTAEEHRRNRKASRFMQSTRRDVRRLVAAWTGSYQYTIDRVIEDMIKRAEELGLRLKYPEDRTKLDFTILVTVQTMNYLHSGRHRVAL